MKCRSHRQSVSGQGVRALTRGLPGTWRRCVLIPPTAVARSTRGCAMRSVTCYMFPQESYGWYKNQETKKSVFGRTLNVRRTPPGTLPTRRRENALRSMTPCWSSAAAQRRAREKRRRGRDNEPPRGPALLCPADRRGARAPAPSAPVLRSAQRAAAAPEIARCIARTALDLAVPLAHPSCLERMLALSRSSCSPRPSAFLLPAPKIGFSAMECARRLQAPSAIMVGAAYSCLVPALSLAFGAECYF